MKVIHKQQLRIEDMQIIEVPVASEVFNLKQQHGLLTVWYFFDEEEKKKTTIEFRILATGQPFDLDLNKYQFMGSEQMGPYVWHVWARELTAMPKRVTLIREENATEEEASF